MGLLRKAMDSIVGGIDAYYGGNTWLKQGYDAALTLQQDLSKSFLGDIGREFLGQTMYGQEVAQGKQTGYQVPVMDNDLVSSSSTVKTPKFKSSSPLKGLGATNRVAQALQQLRKSSNPSVQVAFQPVRPRESKGMTLTAKTAPQIGNIG